MFSVVRLLFYFYLLCSVPLCLTCFSGSSLDNVKRPLTKKETFVVEEVDKMLNQVLSDIKEYGDHIKSGKDGEGNSKEEKKDNNQDFTSKEGNQPINFPSVTPRITSPYLSNEELNPEESSVTLRVSGYSELNPEHSSVSSGFSGYSESQSSSGDGPVLKESKDDSVNFNSGNISPKNGFEEK